MSDDLSSPLAARTQHAGDEADPVQPSITPTGDVDRWALLVGISNYAHEDLNLGFAAQDALGLREKLLEPSAGAFPHDHVLALVDEEATLANLTKALRTFLKRPAQDDLVILFVACHGSRDRDRPDNLYLLPHDADPFDISGTALPMREIELALKETLHSRRVVVLIDACHSGGLGEAFADIRAVHDDAADLNAYLTKLSTSRGGVSLMTSAMANESSVEGEQWGEGHGVFTHFLLEGLRGRADRPPHEGVITVGELFDFVAEQVKDGTKDAQHPHVNAGANRGLVLAVKSSLSARQHVNLAKRLAEAGEVLGEPTCWRGAAVQYGEAIRLRRDQESAVAHALALFRSGDERAAERAVRILGEAPGARLTLGLIQLAQGRAGDAKKTLLTPDPIGDWAEVLFSPSLPRGRRAALLVAVGRVDPEAYGGWEGIIRSPVPEVDALSRVLKTRFGFDEQTRLTDDQATADAIQNSLVELVARSAACEAVVVCLSGHGGQVPSADESGRDDSTFVAFDRQITSAEIDAVLSLSAAGRTTLIASSAHSGRFAERATSGGYEAISACAEDQLDLDGPELSVFMTALIPNLKPDLKGRAVEEATRASLGEAVNTQEPQFSIDASRPPLAGQVVGDAASSGGAVLARVMLGATAAVSTQTLDEIAALVARGDVPETSASALVAEWWRRGQPDHLAKLRMVPPLSSPVTAGAAASAAARGSIALSLAEALEAIAALPAVASNPTLRAEVQKFRRQTRHSAGTATRLRAVLVGLSSFADGSRGVEGALDSVAAVRAALVQAGARTDQITILTNGNATAKEIRAELRRARGRGQERPMLVYWCGSGTLADMPCFDGQAINEPELAKLAGPTATLVAEGISEAPPGSYDGSPVRLRLSLVDDQKGEGRYGRITAALVEALRQSDGLASISASAVSGAEDQRTVLSRDSDVLLADPLAIRVDTLVNRIRDSELAATAVLLARLLEQRNGIDPEAQLQLGILQAQVGEVDGAIGALGRAIEQFGADSRGEARARLHLGRVLLDSERDRARAVSECRLATERDPGLVAAWFWLGRALAELVKHETTAEASDALRTYLVRGAPLGRRSEVMKLLAAMSEAAVTRRS